MMANRCQILAEGHLMSNVVFIHIPKAGGSSVRKMIKSMIPSHRVYPEERLHNITEYNLVSSSTKFLYMSHLGYQFAEQAGAFTLTILRHPIERLLSLYSYFINPGNGVPILNKKEFGEMSISDFLTSDHPAIRMNVENQQVWQIGYGYLASERSIFNQQSKVHISVAALNNIERIDVVGTTNNIPRFMERVADLFGREFTSSDMVRSNVTRNRIKFSDLSHVEKKLLESKVELEWILFDRAQKLS